MFRLVVFFILISSLDLLAQAPTVSDLEQDSFNVGSGGSKVRETSFRSPELTSDKEVNLLPKIAEVFSKVIRRCSKKINKKSKNTYVLINKLTERSFYNLDFLIKKRIDQKSDYFDFSEEVDIRGSSLGDIIREIKKKNYFNKRLSVDLVGQEDITNSTIASQYNSAVYIYLLKDFKASLSKNNFIYNIRLSVINPRTSRVLCNVVKRVDVTDKNRVNPKGEEKASYRETFKNNNFVTVGAYISGNPLSYGHLRIFDAVYKNNYADSLVLSFGTMLEYDRRILDSFYLGVNFSLGYLYYNFPDDVIFERGIKQLLLTAGVKPSYMLTLSETYSIDFLIGGKIEYFHLLGSHNFLISAFTGFRFGYFKVELNYPFPFVKVGVTFPF